MRVHLGSDHAGFELKAALGDRLREQGYDVVDHGPVEYDPVDDYPPFVLRAAQAVVVIEDRGDRVSRVVWGPRIGIRVGTEHPWRCHLADSRAVSAYVLRD